MQTKLSEPQLDRSAVIKGTDSSKRFDKRVLKGMRCPHNWLQFLAFGIVGASGYVINLAVFSLTVKVGHVHHVVGATIAFIVAVSNNFYWNRRWTFAATDGHAGFQAARFFTVSLLAFLFGLGVLETLHSGFGLPAVLAQAISLVVATPLNFVGNRLWSFASKPAA